MCVGGGGGVIGHSVAPPVNIKSKKILKSLLGWVGFKLILHSICSMAEGTTVFLSSGGHLGRVHLEHQPGHQRHQNPDLDKKGASQILLLEHRELRQPG